MAEQRPHRKHSRGAAATQQYLAQCPRGLEEVLTSEIRGLGGEHVDPVPGGALFGADRRVAARIVLWVRSAVRVLESITMGQVQEFDELYELVCRAPWEELIGTERTFAVRASVSRASFTDHHFAALRVKDAVVDRIRKKRGRRPDVDRKSPDVPLRLVVRGREAHLYRDLAGDSMHRRGHRPIQVKSPLSEAVAAGLLMLTEWDRESPLIDPMCGSGTLVLEAAALAADCAPGLDRRFSAERFPDADARLWRELRDEARSRVRVRLPCALLGSDHHAGALGIARKTARAAGMGDVVDFRLADVASFEPPFEPGIVVANPPWGGRLGRGEGLEASWRGLGTFLRRCPGAVAYVLSGDRSLTRHLGLRSSRRWPIRIGPFDARWLRYELRA